MAQRRSVRPGAEGRRRPGRPGPPVKPAGTPFTREPYGVAMNLTDEDLVRRVNTVLEDYREGGADSPWTTAYETWPAAGLKGITGPPAPPYRQGGTT